MRLLLTTINSKYIHTNLAIRLLYQLNKAHDGLAWKEFSIKESTEDIAQQCAGYEVVAFSCYIWNILPTLAVAKLIKEAHPSCQILLGGPEVSYEWQPIIEEPFVDFIIVGEGEVAFQKFLQQYPQVDAVPSLAQKKKGGIHFNALQEIFDLQALAHINPYADDDRESLRHRVLYMETSRGCPYKCEFCLASLDNKVRYLPMAVIQANLLFLMQLGRVIKFLDRTFNIKKDFTIAVFQFILQHYQPGNVFQFEITADIVHPDIIAFIQQQVPKGLLRFEIGIQTVNAQANLAVSRKQNFEKTAQVIRQLQDHVDLHLDLIIGLPYETWNEVKHSVETVFSLHPKELQWGFLKFLKGTPIREKYAEHGYVFDPLPPYQIIHSRYLSAPELQRLSLAEHALELYWNKQKAVRTLRYAGLRYGIFEFLCGVGAVLKKRNLLHSARQRAVYDALHEFLLAAHASDPVLRQLLALDFAMSYKVRPAAPYWPALPDADITEHVLKIPLPPAKRYVGWHMDIDVTALMQEGRIVEAAQTVIVAYSGTAWPVLHSLAAQAF